MNDLPSMNNEDPADGVEPVVRKRRARRNGSPSDELSYEPPLDGLRAVAVVAVLFFHARFSWAAGGFLGVSTFFTLSGFLITSLLLGEWRRSGGVSFRGFFSRRFRRLLPASWFTLGLVVVMGALGVWSTDQMRSLRGDVPWSIVELVNWHFIASDRSYGAQFDAPSPLEHYWSLAIEQQFYLILPLVILGLLGWSQRRALARSGGTAAPNRTPIRILVTVLGLAAAISWYLNWHFAQSSVDRSYFGTDTRLAELAVGALLACVGLRRIRGGSVQRGRLLAVLGVLGLIGSAVLWYAADLSATWMYPWGFMAASAASASMIVGSLRSGALRSALSLAPVVALGRISYGVYLLHWPIFLWLTPARTGLPQWPLFGLRMAVTLAGAIVMFRFLETPVRSGSPAFRKFAVRMTAPAAVVILLASAVVTSGLPAPSELASASESAPTTVPPAPLRVLVLGDQLAASWTTLGTTVGAEPDPGTEGGSTNDPENPDQPQVTIPDTGAPVEVTVASAPDCGLAVGGFVRLANGELERDADRCGKVVDAWEGALLATKPDVVLVWAGLRDVSDRRMSTDAPWQAPGSPEIDDFLSTEVRELVDRFSADGVPVVLGTAPHMRNTAPGPEAMPPVLPPDPVRAGLLGEEWVAAEVGIPGPGHAENDDARIDHWNELLGAAGAATGAEVIDLAGAMANWPGGEFDPERRDPGGVGLTAQGMTELAESVAAELEKAKLPPQRPDPTAQVAADAPLPAAPPFTPRKTVAGGQTADVLVVGDSVAFNIGLGLTDWAEGTGDAKVQSAGQFGCPVARGGQFKFLRNIETFEDRCDWAKLYPDWVDSNDPDVAVLVSGIWEVVDRRLPGDDRFRHVGEPSVDRYVLAEFLSAIDTLGSRGANVVVLTYPHFEAGRDQGYSDLPESDPTRVDRLNEILAEAVSMRPGVAMLVDFQDWLAQQPGGELDPAKREDGLHFYDAYSPSIGAWLGPIVIDVAHNGVPPPPGG